MSTPTTADIRTWARANGHAVSDRGAIPAAVRAAHSAATGGEGAPVAKAPARKAPAKKAPARKAPAKKVPAAKSTPAPAVETKPAADPFHERISALEHQVAALIATIEGLVAPKAKAKADAKKRSKKKR